MDISDSRSQTFDVGDTRARRFNAGDVLFAPGNASENAFVVLAGRVCVEEASDPVPVIVGPGEIVGEIDLLLDQPHSATVVALEPVSALPLNRAQLAEAMRRTPRRTAARARDVFTELARKAAGTLAKIAEAAPADASAVEQVVAWSSIMLAVERTGLNRQVGAERLVTRDLPFTVGRRPSPREVAPRNRVDLVLADDKPYNLSRRHFAVDANANGPLLRDTGSLLGTEVNGVRIGTGRSSSIAPLRLGENYVIAGSASSPFRFILSVRAG